MKKNFTLIELIIVTAVIGILVTFLLPSLGKAREKAQIAVCLSQQKQIGTAKFLYLNDNNQRFHSTVVAGTDPSPGKQWVGTVGTDKSGGKLKWAGTVTQRPLNRYLNHTKDGVPLKVALCPLEYRGPDAYLQTGSSYFGNSNPAISPSLMNKSTHQIRTPAITVLISEAGANAYAEGYPTTSPYLRMNHRPGTYTWGFARLDNSAINYRFFWGEGRSTINASKVANFVTNF